MENVRSPGIHPSSQPRWWGRPPRIPQTKAALVHHSHRESTILSLIWFPEGQLTSEDRGSRSPVKDGSLLPQTPGLDQAEKGIYCTSPGFLLCHRLPEWQLCGKPHPRLDVHSNHQSNKSLQEAEVRVYKESDSGKGKLMCADSFHLAVY